ncbi:MAG: peptidylprolyl isomerase [Flavobacteriales bacterium]
MKKLIVSALLLSAAYVNAQNLIKIGDQQITSAEFLQMYNKKSSFQDTSKTKEELMKEYLDLYTKFRLIVKEAESLGLDTTKKFIDELAGYRNQLAESYLTDKSVSDELVKEAYERMKYDRHASHILILSRLDDMPEDTLKAYKKALELMNRAKAGEDFAKLAKENSEDPSAKQNGGDLGFFSALRMVYPFESAAYNTPVNEVSKPVRTKFGYHIIKVHAERPSVGEVKVAHIMVRLKENGTADENKNAEDRINEIYGKLQSGSTWEEMVRISEDYQTAQKGGDLGYFGPNKFPKEFEDASFALKEKGEIYKPTKTAYGWHIIKLIDKKGMDSFEKMQSELKKSIAKNDRSNLSKDVVYNRIMKKNGFKEFPKNLKKIFEITDSTLEMGTWKIPANVELKKPLFQIGNIKYTQKDLADYMFTREGLRKNTNYKQLVNQYYDNFKHEKVFEFENKNLEQNYPAFKATMKEYRDGMLKFEITDAKVWSKASRDTTGLKEFYNANKDKWMWPNRIKGDVYICINAEVAKQVKALLDKGNTLPQVLETVNKSSQLNVRVLQGAYSKEDYPALGTFYWKKGVSDVAENASMFYVFKIDDILSPTPKKIEEARGIITSAYQNYLEENWMKELRAKYPVVVNNDEFNVLLKQK